MSQKIEHTRKKHMARKMMTQEELKNKTPLFQTKAWIERVYSRANALRNRLVQVGYAKIRKQNEKDKASKVAEVAPAQISQS